MAELTKSCLIICEEMKNNEYLDLHVINIEYQWIIITVKNPN